MLFFCHGCGIGMLLLPQSSFSFTTQDILTNSTVGSVIGNLGCVPGSAVDCLGLSSKSTV